MNSHEDYIKYRVAKSDEIFQDALLLAENKRWNSCVNRLYYSIFHLVSALLHLNGIDTKSHDGLKTQFLLNYVKTKLVDLEFGKLYSKLIDWRQESDYSVFVEFRKTDVFPIIDKTMEFNILLKRLIDEKTM